jgi:hypothetical protein
MPELLELFFELPQFIQLQLKLIIILQKLLLVLPVLKLQL